MIKRYTLPQIGKIWTDHFRYETWLKIEMAICNAWNKLGEIPDRNFEEIRKKAKFDEKRIGEIEKIVKHDVIAFLTSLSENIGDSSRYVHLGVTSSDILDTSLAYLLKKSISLILEELRFLLSVLKEKAFKHKNSLMMGRTHGVHAEPITFGLKMAGFYAEFKRNYERLNLIKQSVCCGKISGVVGTYSHLTPRIEEMVMSDLKLKTAFASTQVVSRDGIAEMLCCFAVIGGTIERLALEIRHLQRTEVSEVEEFFSEGQKGSSAMPHKRNPIVSENLSGQARLLRSYAQAGLENMALWHERDISHSSVERIVIPDASILIYYCLYSLRNLIKGLYVNDKRMKRNMKITNGLVYSQQALLKLIQIGVTREVGYRIVQKNAMLVWNKGGDFKDKLLNDSELKSILKRKNMDKLKISLETEECLKNIDYIFNKIF